MEPNYRKHKIINVVNITKVVTIFSLDMDKDYSFPGEKHDFWEIVYAERGTSKICAGNETVLLTEGCCAFHKPHEFHGIFGNGETQSRVIVISFVCSSGIMKNFREKIINIPKNLRFYLNSILSEASLCFEPSEKPLYHIHEKNISPIGAQQLVRMYLEQFLIMLLRHESLKHCNTAAKERKSIENQLVNSICSSLAANLYKNATIEEICADITYSRAYISRIFKANTGYTVSAYYTMLKISEAKRLIAETDYNFSQISYILMYDNPHYFSTVFKKQTGLSPTEYKRQVTNNPENILQERTK